MCPLYSSTYINFFICTEPDQNNQGESLTLSAKETGSISVTPKETGSISGTEPNPALLTEKDMQFSPSKVSTIKIGSYIKHLTQDSY